MNNIKTILILTFLLILSVASKIYPQADSIKIYWIKPIKVESTYEFGKNSFSIERDSYSESLNKNGFGLITKGAFFAQDVYSDGYKRGDINVVIDGERYHNACPNRMDPPITRVNPVSMSSVSLYKTNSTLQSGFAGSVEFERKKPQKEFKSIIGLSGKEGYSKSFDAYLNSNYSYNNVNLRYSFGKPYNNGENQDFVKLYSYKDNYNYTYFDGNINGIYKNAEYGVSYSNSKNILFPYLQMDEMYNNVFSGYFKYNKYKMYFNYTDHLMTNELRVSPTAMETKAKNFTFGIFNDFAEFYYRNWISDNKISMSSNVTINKAIPNLNQYSVSVNKSFFYGDFSFNGKIGGIFNFIGHENDEFYKVNYSDADNSNFFYRLGLSGSYNKNFYKDFNFGTILEFSAEAPEAENLYIAIRRSGNNPWWSGNPGLSNPKRITSRLFLSNNLLNLEFYYNYVIDYVNLSPKTTNSRNYLTYDNINVNLLGTNVSFKYKFINTDISYIYAQNTTGDIPLSEIAPLRINTTLTTPDLFNFVFFINHIYHNSQKRVDETLKEKPSNAFNIVNIGSRYLYKKTTVYLELNNLFNNNYFVFLSFARNPYSSGVQVFEPGRHVKFGVLFSF